MIKFNDRFSTDHDGRQWVLYETYMGKASKKDGVLQEPKEQARESYYGNLRQVCNKVLDLDVAEHVRDGSYTTHDLMHFIGKKEWIIEGICRGYV